jgi:hypothetical protein
MILLRPIPRMQEMLKSRSPKRKRIKRIITWLAATTNSWLAMVIPSPGAVCPAMVRLSLLMVNRLVNVIVPDTSKTTVLAPDWVTAQRRLPWLLLSASVFTTKTLPPRPPQVYLPAPSAVGKARRFPAAGVKSCGILKSLTSNPNSLVVVRLPTSVATTRIPVMFRV